MKSFYKFRRIRSLILVYVLFSLSFPFGLFAETTYKTPRNSISYFVENQEEKNVAIVAPPEPVVEEQKATEDILSTEPALVSPVQKASEPGNIDEHFEMSWKSEQPASEKVEIEKKKPAETVKTGKTVKTMLPSESNKAPIVVQPKKVRAIPEPNNEVGARIESAPFAATLAKMQSRRAERVAEAEKLGIVLPSQGGDMNAVSPSLNKINATLKNIIDRHKCPASGDCNFCR